MKEDIIKSALSFIEKIFESDYSGHDYFHTCRVFRAAKMIAEKENADVFTAELAALLHDVDDKKLSPETYDEYRKRKKDSRRKRRIYERISCAING